MSPSLISGSGEDGCLDSQAGVEELGHMGCYNPVEDVSTYKGCELCQLTAPCCQLARPALHIERLSCSAHWAPWAPRSQRAGESFMFSLQLASNCTTHVPWSTVRRFRGKTNISGEWKRRSFALLAADTSCSFTYITDQTFSLSFFSSQPQTDWCAHSLIEMQRLTSRKKKKEKRIGLLSLYQVATPRHTNTNQPGQNELKWVSVGLKIEIASAALIYFISIGTHLHSWELMARISMNVKAGCCAVMHLCCFVLPWKLGGKYGR